MKRILIFFLVAIVCIPSFAQTSTPIIIPLWPDGAPNDNGIVTEEGHPTPRSVDNVSKPELWVFPAFRPNGTVIIACPGGGYYYLEIEKEGTGLAPWFNYIGVTLAVLKYRMPNGHFETTLSDVQEAVKIMRQHTEDWGVNPERVGVMGCSAGGNLAIQASVQFTSREHRPDFQILLYPFTTMNDFENNIMFGPNPSEELIRKYSVLDHVKPDTPRAFIACSADDSIVPFDDSIKYFKELQTYRIPSVLHIYPTGGHGWCEGPWFHYSREWKMELERWLSEW